TKIFYRRRPSLHHISVPIPTQAEPQFRFRRSTRLKGFCRRRCRRRRIWSVRSCICRLGLFDQSALLSGTLFFRSVLLPRDDGVLRFIVSSARQVPTERQAPRNRFRRANNIIGPVIPPHFAALRNRSRLG